MNTEVRLLNTRIYIDNCGMVRVLLLDSFIRTALRIFQESIHEKGLGKVEPNSYSDECKHNRNSWGVINLCIDKIIHYFLKPDHSPG